MEFGQLCFILSRLHQLDSIQLIKGEEGVDGYELMVKGPGDGNYMAVLLQKCS